MLWVDILTHTIKQSQDIMQLLFWVGGLLDAIVPSGLHLTCGPAYRAAFIYWQSTAITTLTKGCDPMNPGDESADFEDVILEASTFIGECYG